MACIACLANKASCIKLRWMQANISSTTNLSIVGRTSSLRAHKCSRQDCQTLGTPPVSSPLVTSSLLGQLPGPEASATSRSEGGSFRSSSVCPSFPVAELRMHAQVDHDTGSTIAHIACLQLLEPKTKSERTLIIRFPRILGVRAGQGQLTNNTKLN
jgi:hypothetical protein